MDLRVVIVTWNSEKQIGTCLDSLLSNSGGLDIETYVVDNASGDRTRETVSEVLGKHSGAKVVTIWNPDNRGFAAGCNQGIEKSTADFVLLLNPDTVVLPGSLKTMLDFLRANPEIGVAGGRVMGTDGKIQPSVRRFPDLLSQGIILTKLHHAFPASVNRYMCEGFDYGVTQDVDQVRGAYFFISRKAIETVGVLDEKSFFIWFEEVDFCKRVIDAGMRVVYYAESEVMHEGGSSFAQALSLKKQRWMNRSMINYFKKHGSSSAVAVLWVLYPLSLLLAALVQWTNIKPKRYA